MSAVDTTLMELIQFLPTALALAVTIAGSVSLFSSILLLTGWLDR